MDLCFHVFNWGLSFGFGDFLGDGSVRGLMREGRGDGGRWEKEEKRGQMREVRWEGGLGFGRGEADERGEMRGDLGFGRLRVVLYEMRTCSRGF